MSEPTRAKRRAHYETGCRPPTRPPRAVRSLATLPPPQPPPPPWRVVPTPYTGEHHARGFAAAVALRRGDVVDVAPVLVFDAATYAAHLSHTALKHYVFADRSSGCVLLALSAGSLFNHARTPTLDYRVSVEGATVTFTAARDVEAGEELTISYGEVWWDEGEREGDRIQPSHDHMDDEGAFLGAIAL